MKKVVVLVTFCLILLGCQSHVSKESLPLMQGYWEIEKVVFEEGEDKEYASNESYDYFEIKGTHGFRLKVMPQLDGTFQTNNIKEQFIIREKDDRFYIDFTTDYAKWSEELLLLNDKVLVLKNADNKEYHYKKAQAINVLANEKATK